LPNCPNAKKWKWEKGKSRHEGTESDDDSLKKEHSRWHPATHLMMDDDYDEGFQWHYRDCRVVLLIGSNVWQFQDWFVIEVKDDTLLLKDYLQTDDIALLEPRQTLSNAQAMSICLSLRMGEFRIWG